jgi:hypothetical protein
MINELKTNILKTGKNSGKTGEQVFWNTVDIQSQWDCWHWLGLLWSNGYGQFNYRGNRYISSRTSYQLANSTELATNINVCHKCDNRSCCNPDHLFSGSQLDNIQDAVKKGKFYNNRNLGSGRRKLLDSDVEMIRKLHSSGNYLQKQLADMYSVRANHISRIVNNRRRTWDLPLQS